MALILIAMLGVFQPDAAGGLSTTQPVVSPVQAPADGAAIQDASFVNTSYEAEEALRKARDRAAQGDWAGAATAMQNVMRQFGDRLIRVEAGRYVGIPYYIHAEILNWPEIGQRAYRAAYEPAAARELEKASSGRDVAALLKVVTLYFPTRSGALALDVAGEIAMEAADFEAAAQWYDDLLAGHPDKPEFEAQWRLKRAMCDAWRGDLVRLETLAREGEAVGEGRVNWGGKSRTVRTFAADALAELTTDGGGAEIHATYVTPEAFLGGSARHAFYSTNAMPEAGLWRCRIHQPAHDELSDAEAYDSAEAALYLRSVRSGRWLTASPVAGGGRVFVSSPERVWAIDPNGPETILWCFSVSDSAPADRAWLSEDEPPGQQTLLYADGRLYAHLNSDAASKAEPDAPGGRRSMLVCLEADTGTVVWKKRYTQLVTQFEELSFDGAPLLHRGRLYAVARRRKGFGFEACLLLCIDPATGRLVWNTHVGEAATGSYGYTHSTRTHTAATGDRVFLHTNLGTVACVGATTGMPIWLTSYSSRYADQTEAAWPTRFGQPIRTWQYQPTMLWNDRVVCLPMDLDDMLILSQRDGTLTRRVKLDRLFNPESVLGIHGDLLYAAGSQLVAYDLKRDAIAWERPLPGGRPFGRGAVSSVGVLIPTLEALLRYPLEGGPVTSYAWRPEQAGNVLPIDDQIIIASSDYVSGLVSRDDAFARLSKRMRDQLSDPDPALDLAELAFSLGDDKRGLDAVKAAMERMPPRSDRAEDQKIRQRLFDRLERLAAAIHERPHDEAARPGAADTLAIELLTAAGRCADTPTAEVRTRLSLAAIHLARGDAGAALGLYQEVLRRPEWGNIRLPLRRQWMPAFLPAQPFEPQQETSIYLVVESLVRATLDRHGGEIHRAYESDAESAYRVARKSGEAAPLVSMAAAYPHSAAAADALFAAARLAQGKGDVAEACRLARLALARGDGPKRPEVLRFLAEQLMATGRTDEARMWIKRGVRDYPSLRFGGEDATRGFADMLGDLRRASASTADAPSVRWPVAMGYKRQYGERVSILSAMDAAPVRATPWDIVLTYASGRIEGRMASGGRAYWPQASACPTLPILLGSDATRLYLAGAHHLFSLGRTNGARVWQFGEAPRDDAMSDPEEAESWTDHVMVGSRIFSASDRGDIVCIDAADGTLRWRREVPGGTASHLAADDRLVFCAKWRGRHNVIHALDASTGELRAQLQCEDSRPIQALHPTPGGSLLVILSRSLMCIDLPDGRVRWSLAAQGHFLISTFLADVDGFIISDNGRQLSKFDYESGRCLWRTERIGTDDRDGLWTGLADGRVIGGARDALRAFDSADGRSLWTAARPAGMRLQAPVLTSDSIVSISMDESAVPAGEPFERAARYRIIRHALADGAVRDVTAKGALLAGPFESFGGLFARDGALLLLDGEQLFGYVSVE